MWTACLAVALLLNFFRSHSNSFVVLVLSETVLVIESRHPWLGVDYDYEHEHRDAEHEHEEMPG